MIETLAAHKVAVMAGLLGAAVLAWYLHRSRSSSLGDGVPVDPYSPSGPSKTDPGGSLSVAAPGEAPRPIPAPATVPDSFGGTSTDPASSTSGSTTVASPLDYARSLYSQPTPTFQGAAVAADYSRPAPAYQGPTSYPSPTPTFYAPPNLWSAPTAPAASSTFLPRNVANIGA